MRAATAGQFQIRIRRHPSILKVPQGNHDRLLCARRHVD